jgi:hypothetical protein
MAARIVRAEVVAFIRGSAREPGGRATGRLAVGGDADYHITIRFQSGRELERRLGYVTSGMDFHDEFSVSETDIVMKRVSVD